MKIRNLPIRLVLRDDAPQGTALELPQRNMKVATIIVTIMFAIFAAILLQQIASLDMPAGGGLFDLVFMLFSLFWILGWSVGVIVLGALTMLLLFWGESARIADGRLIYMLNLGPGKVIGEYELARIGKPRVVPDETSGLTRVRFDYDGKEHGLADLMPADIAVWNVALLRDALDGVTAAPPEFAVEPVVAAPPRAEAPRVEAAPVQCRLPLLTMLVLVAANLIPLFGVLLGGWTLAEVMVLFWAESAVVGFYTLLKIAVVAKWWSPLPGLFFTGHFGGFMAIHFLFINLFFVRGLEAGGPDPGELAAVAGLFAPLWPALLALVLSHGVSFALNFIAQREYEGASVSALMRAPYGRVVVMHLTLIFGGWMVMLLQNTMAALVLLIVLKVIADLRAHYGERKPAAGG